MTETTTLRGALVMSYPSALGPADEPLTIEWPEGHSYAVVATALHGGAVLGTTATEDEAWEIYDQWPKTDCRCRSPRSEVSNEAVELLSVLIQDSEFTTPGQAACRCDVF